jgi:hypothetical protein
MTDADDPRPSLLIVTMGHEHVAPARMPYELRRAGFSVSLLAPRGALATSTEHLDRLGMFPEPMSFRDWVHALIAAVRNAAPVMILPGDDLALRALLQLVIEPPAGLRADVRDELAAIIRASLGDPSRCLDVVDKSRLLEAARTFGVAVADGGGGSSVDEAIAIAGRIGYPVIVRPSFGTSGRGTMRCDGADALRVAIREMPPPSGWHPADTRRFVVQRWLDGEVVTRASLAWHGREIAGVTRGRLETHPSPFGPASVVEFVGLPQVAQATRALFTALEVHGFAGTQFVLEGDTPHLVKINRRMLPATHGGRLVGVDLAHAFAAAYRGQAWSGPDDLAPGAGPRFALFPQEWHRDPHSAWLSTLAVDAPWHDARLFRAMLQGPARANP